MAVPSPQVARRLQGAGIRIDKGRACFRAEAVETFMEQRCRLPAPEPEEAPLRLEAGSHCLYEFCPEQRRVQPLTVANLERRVAVWALALCRDPRCQAYS